ncbi:NAD(P)-dependent oxidoreductase [Kordiimonas sp. SCSIO 12610]|uniref:NAD-dependent epimerase/dehydratase family protein n=1 Tax=Kordiimonas sp. SCSIO 12610 TaxID=2829597 RepID=UPI00210E125A|nr:NAD(P)-dependent oxidoreductase [Kordiimonas sp. SCSIO 12610]UTW56620.1 NAD(P)-dependent oxidoreductase [Kordiimonas sp. SCSIO 12610]
MSNKAAPTNTDQVIALTGATGFLGRHLLEQYVSAGHKVKALTRSPKTSSETIEWVDGTLEDDQALETLCKGADIVVHCAGLTKALNRNEFFDVNLGGTKNLLKAAKNSTIKRFLLISSLAAREPQISHYGASKNAAEGALKAGKWPFRWTIVRPPAIYGPHDMEILKIFKSSNFGFLPAPGSAKNRFSMIHVEDLASAIIKLPETGYNHDIVEIDDGKPNGYRLDDIATAIEKIDERKPKIIPVPFPVLAFLGIFSDLFAQIIRKPAMLTLSSAYHLSHPDWTTRNSRRPVIPEYSPRFGLEAGLQNTLEWYRQNGHL